MSPKATESSSASVVPKLKSPETKFVEVCRAVKQVSHEGIRLMSWRALISMLKKVAGVAVVAQPIGITTDDFCIKWESFLHYRNHDLTIRSSLGVIIITIFTRFTP